MAMDLIADIEVVVPDSQFGKRDCKIINLAHIVEVLLPVPEQAFKQFVRLLGVSQLLPCQGLIVYLVGVRVVVVECLFGFGVALCSGKKALALSVCPRALRAMPL